VNADGFAHDAYQVDQNLRPVSNEYRISALVGGQPAGGPVAYVRQKRLAMREDIRFFADEAETEELFRIKARSMLDMGGAKYDVTDAAGTTIGRLEHVFSKSLFRSTWRVVGADDQPLAVAQEKNAMVAIARRLVDFVPYIGGLVPIPYNFEIADGDRELGHFTRRLGSVRDTYVLDLSGDPEKTVDRRLGIALAVGLDALQNR
jgi:uncharacterized protein YxjI